MFEQGWQAIPFAEQFPGLSKEEGERLDKINIAISTLHSAGILADCHVRRIRQKSFPAVVARALKRAEGLGVYGITND